MLVEAGAQMDAPDRLGWSPLAWAAFMGADSAALALLEAGADPNFWAEPNFVTALGQLMGVWHMAQEGGPGSPALWEPERFAIAKALLEHGADPNRFRGTAPFEFALFSGRADLVALFLDHGATLEALPNPRLREHFLENPGEIGDLLRNAPEHPDGWPLWSSLMPPAPWPLARSDAAVSVPSTLSAVGSVVAGSGASRALVIWQVSSPAAVRECRQGT